MFIRTFVNRVCWGLIPFVDYRQIRVHYHEKIKPNQAPGDVLMLGERVKNGVA